MTQTRTQSENQQLIIAIICFLLFLIGGVIFVLLQGCTNITDIKSDTLLTDDSHQLVECELLQEQACLLTNCQPTYTWNQDKMLTFVSCSSHLECNAITKQECINLRLVGCTPLYYQTKFLRCGLIIGD